MPENEHYVTDVRIIFRIAIGHIRSLRPICDIVYLCLC